MKLFAFLLLAIPTGHAASWYVDPDAVGSNNGTSWVNAWPLFSSVVWNGAGVKAGDTLFISGGTTSKTYITNNNHFTVDTTSGTSNSPITIRVGQDAGHNGTVIFDYDAYGNSATVPGLQANNRPWVIFDGELNGASNWKFLNLRNHTNRSTAYAIYGDAPSWIETKWLTFSNCNQGIRFQNLGLAAGVRIHNCEFQQIRGNAAIAVLSSTLTNSSTLIYSNNIALVLNTAIPPGEVTAYSGPDGIQSGSGTDIFNNTFTVSYQTNFYTSDQHCDFLQMGGYNIKVYNNDFINIGDAAITMGGALSDTVSNVWVFNNVFRIVDVIDPSPEFIRVFAKTTAPQEWIQKFYVFNNTFIDNPYTTTYYGVWSNTNFFGSFKFKNNLFYNCGGGSVNHTLRLETWPSMSPSDVEFERNVYYHPSALSYINFGTNYPAAVWVNTGIDIGSKTNQPVFASYAPNASNNDLRLHATDTIARDAGVDLSGFFTTDKDGNSRQGLVWDIGAFEFGSSAPTPPIPDVTNHVRLRKSPISSARRR